MNKKSFSKKLIAALSIGLTVLLTSGVAVTAAAFVGLEWHKQKITIDLGYAKYFGAGSGVTDPATGLTTYNIDTNDQFRNFAYLYNLGLFDETDAFVLTKSLDFTAENPVKPITPIGNMHVPFVSTFDGQDFALKGLNVVGTDTADLGLFGTVGINGTIKNFILDQPKVTSKTTFAGPWSAQNYLANIDKNPLRSKIGNNGVVTLTPTSDGKIPNKNDSNINDGIIKFTLSITGIPTEYTPIVEISDPTYISESGGIYTVDTTKEVSKYLTIRVYTQGLVTLDDETTRLAQYTVETIKLYYDGTADSKYIVANPNYSKCYKSMINPQEVEYTLMNQKYTYHNNKQVHTAGVVVGNLYGVADRIVAHKPILRVEGTPFISNSILIGRKIDDDNKSPLARVSMETDKLMALNYIEVPNDWENSDVDDGNRMLKDIYSEPGTSQSGFIDYDYHDTFRIYGSNWNGTRDNINETWSGKRQSGTTGLKLNNKIKLVDPEDSTKTITKKALQFTKDAQANSHFVDGFLWFGRGYDGVRYNNGIYMYTSAKDTNSPIGRLLSGKTGSFYLTFEFDYVYFDDSYNNVNDGENALKQLNMYGYKKQNKFEDGVGFYAGSETTKQYYPLPSDTSKDRCYLPDVVTMANDKPNPDTANKTLLKFPFADLEPEEGTGRNPLLFAKENIAGPVPNSYTAQSYEIQHKSVKVKATPKIDITNLVGALMPVFFLGMDSSKDTNKNYSFNLLNFEVVISDINGNYGGQLVKVDFARDVNNNNNPVMLDGGLNNQGKPSGEWKSTKARPSISTLNEKGEVAAASGAPALAPIAGAEQFGSYSIKVTYNGSTVTVTYQITDTVAPTLTVAPFNTKGFSEARIQQGTV